MFCEDVLPCGIGELDQPSETILSLPDFFHRVSSLQR
jgi:hypothetical protein